MKFVVVIPDFEKVSFFANIAQGLIVLQHTVVFYSPALHIQRALKQLSFQVSNEYDIFVDADRILFWNGTGSKEKQYCQAHNRVCWFFENGYWQGETIQINKQGVNNEAEYANLSIDEMLHFTYSRKK